MAASDTASTLAHIQRALRDTYGGRPWLCATDILQSAVAQCAEVQALGASSVFAIGAGMGTGPYDDTVPSAVLDVRGSDMMSSIRASEAALERLPPAVQARVDAWDPDRRARVVRAIFSSGRPVAGRRCWGGRPTAWQALEDKTIVDAIWDRCGVPRAPSRVVPPTDDALRTAHRALDAGDGTVWAADNRDGWHGGATGLRWVQSETDATHAARWMAEHAHQVRVMPFLEGTPCSIHGIVFDDHVVALRPCEMVVLRRPGTMRFKYARVSTFWDPPAADRAQMRSMARTVGAHLRETVDYRGVFTIDGILSRSGFRPTELNPRFGAAIGVMSGSLPELHLYLLHCAIVERVDVDWRPAELERVILEAADAHRRGGAMQVIPQHVTEQRSTGLVPDGAGWRIARASEDPHATAHLGPAPSGGVLRVTFAPAHTPVGPASAPRAVAMLACLAAHWDLDLGPLEAARSVR